MRLPRASLLASVLLVMCLAGCQSSVDAPSSVPEWLLGWNPPAKGIDASVPLDTAFKMGAVLYHWSTPVSLPTSATTWLLAGKTLGVGLVRLDPEGSWQTLELLYVDSQRNTWNEGATANITSDQPCHDGDKVYDSLTFPEPVCSNALLKTSTLNNSFSLALTTWYASSHIYILVRVATQIHNTDTNNVPVQIDTFTGQMGQSGAFTTIIVPVDAKDSMFIASSAGNEVTVQLAQAMVTHRDELVPLG